ncbi:cytochrome P450 [Chaetomium tenue]|uniref:Cytochrome P450 n=1 Tax=Chaetomium tenue TaxID=1854479 RepID=A0ACB7PCN5_9PEZI|nr:cytochrome P450 [Chaetomium globosum]
MIAAVLLLTVVGIAVAVARHVKGRKMRQQARPLPGPIAPPFIGPFFSIPDDVSWVKLSDWGKKHGPIYEFELFGTRHVWITEEKTAQQLLSKRAAIYSDRPLIPSLPDNRTSGDYLALLGRSDMWKRQRKLCNVLMASSSREDLHAYPTIERNRFLYQMYREPSKYIEWIEQFTARTVSRLCWGTAQPAQVLRHVTYGLLETISPSGSLPNLMSFLRFLPAFLSPWQKKEKARHDMEDRLCAACVTYVRENMIRGTAKPCFTASYYQDSQDENPRSSGSEAPEASHVISLMAIAGALTIGSPIQSYLLAMVHHPEWERRLQEEIDTVLGGRCPEWEDRHKLPMLRATIKEVIRWRPAVPMGIPHASEADDVYDGYFIPGGATIHPVEWAMTRDERYYPDPEAFHPGRWLDPDSPVYRDSIDRSVNLNGYSQFGFGRRTCQGIPIVEQDLFLTMGGMAWAFNIRKARDPVTGAERPVHWNDYTPLLIAKPKWFPFEAVPRGQDKIDRMKEMNIATRRYVEEEQAISDMDLSQFERELGHKMYVEDVTIERALDEGWELI